MKTPQMVLSILTLIAGIGLQTIASALDGSSTQTQSRRFKVVRRPVPAPMPHRGLADRKEGGVQYHGRYRADLPAVLGSGAFVRFAAGSDAASPWTAWAPGPELVWDTGEHGIIPVGALQRSTATTVENTVRYIDLYDGCGMDVVYSFQPSKLKEDIVLNRLDAPPEGAKHLVIPLRLRQAEGLEIRVNDQPAPLEFETDGAIQFYRGGRMALQFFPPSAQDAFDRGTRLRWRCSSRAGETRLDLLVPASWLARAAYPVRIDPSAGDADPPIGRLRFLRDQELGYFGYNSTGKQYDWYQMDSRYPSGSHVCSQDPEVSNYLDMVCGDLNKDGYDELIVLETATADEGTFASLWDFNNNTKYTVQVVEADSTALRITAGDADNDGRDDLFVLWKDNLGYYVTFFHTLDDFTFEQSELTLPAGDVAAVDLVAADLDGDLDAEVATLLEQPQGDYNAWVWVNDPSGHFPLRETAQELARHSCRSFQTVKRGPFGIIEWETRTHRVDPRAIAAADLDQDHQDELIVLADYWDELKNRLGDDAGTGCHWDRKGDHSFNVEVFDPYASDVKTPVAKARWEQSHLRDIVGGDYWGDNRLRVFAMDSDGEIHYSKPYNTQKPAIDREKALPVLSGATRVSLGDIDRDSLAALFSDFDTHEEKHIVGAYLELPPCHKGVNNEDTSSGIMWETASGQGTGSHCSLTTRMSVGVEVEEDLKIFQVGASAKYTLSAAIGRADSTMVETRVSAGVPWTGELKDNPELDDGILLFQDTFNVYYYDVINARTNDPAYFTIITPTTSSYTSVSRATYETETESRLGLKGNRVGGRAATAAQNRPESVLLSTGNVYAQAGQGQVTGGLAISTNVVSEADLSLGFGFESEVKAGVVGVSVTCGLGVDFEWGTTFTTELTRDTSFEFALGGLGPAAASTGKYQVGTYVKKERQGTVREFFHLGFWVPTSSWGGGFSDAPAISNFSRTPAAPDVPNTAESIHLEINVTDGIGVDSVKYRILKKADSSVIQDATRMIPSPIDSNLYTADVPVSGLPKDTDLVFEILAEDNNFNTSTLRIAGLHSGSSPLAFRIVDPSESPPVPSIAGTYTGNNEGDEIAFTASSTGTGVTLTWNFGDGSAVATGANPKHKFAKTGRYTVTLTAVDASGKTGQTTLAIDIGNTAPTVMLTIVTNTVRAGEPFKVEGQFTDPGTAGTFNVNWDFGDGTARSGQWTKGASAGSFKVLPESYRYSVNQDKQYTLALKVGDGTTNVTASTSLSVKKNNAPNTPSLGDAGRPRLGRAYDLDLDASGKTAITAIWQVSDPDGDTVSSQVYLAKDQSAALERSNFLVADADPTDQQADLPIQGAGTYYWMIVASDPYGGVSRSSILRFTVDDTAPTWTDSEGVRQALFEQGQAVVGFGRAQDPSAVQYNLYVSSAPLTYSAAERTQDISTVSADGLWPLRHTTPFKLPSGTVYYLAVRAEDMTHAYPGYAYPGGARVLNEEQNTVVRMAYETPGIGVVWTLAQLSANAIDRLGTPMVIAEPNGIYSTRGSITIAAGDTLVIGPDETLRFDDDTGACVVNVLGTLKSADHGVACPRVLVVGFSEEHGSFIDGAQALVHALRQTGAQVEECDGMLPVEQLDAYDAVFIALGCAPQNHEMTMDEVMTLDAYLGNGQGGSAAYLEGGRFWSRPTAQPLMQRFGVELASGSGNYFGAMEGMESVAGLFYPAPWPGEANADDWINPVPPAVPLVHSTFPPAPIMIQHADPQGLCRTVTSVAEFGGFAANLEGPGGMPLIHAVLYQCLLPHMAGACAPPRPKTITSLGQQKGDWHGITASFLGTGGSVLLKSTTVEYAQTGVSLAGGVLDLDTCAVLRCAQRGIYADHAVQVKVMDSLVADNSGEGFAGIALAGAIGRTTIQRNGADGVVYALHQSQGAGLPLFMIHDCVIAANTLDGVNLGWVDANVQLFNNQIHANRGAGIRMTLEGLMPVGAGPLLNGNLIRTNADGCSIDGVHPSLSGNTIVGNTRYGVYLVNSVADLGRMPAQPGMNIIHSNGSGYDAYNVTPASLVMAEGNTWNVNPAIPPVPSQFYPGPLNVGFDYCPYSGGNCAGGGAVTPVTVTASQSMGGIDLSWTLIPGQTTPLGSYVVHFGTNSTLYPFSVGVGDQTTARLNDVLEGVPYFIAVSATDTSTGARLLPSTETSYTLVYRGDIAVLLQAWPDTVMLGTPARFECLVTNRGPDTAVDVRVTTSVPGGAALAQFSTSQGAASFDGVTVELALGLLPAGGACTVAFSFTPTDPDLEDLDIRVDVAGESNDPAPGDNSAEIVVVVRKDTDADGMPDDWEIANDLNPNNAADATDDPDGDGMGNLDEFLAGTLPYDKGSALRIVEFEIAEDAVRISFFAVAEKQYLLERTGTVSPAHWALVAGDLAGADALTTVTVAFDETTPSAFWRVRLKP